MAVLAKQLNYTSPNPKLLNPTTCRKNQQPSRISFFAVVSVAGRLQYHSNDDRRLCDIKQSIESSLITVDWHGHAHVWPQVVFGLS